MANFPGSFFNKQSVTGTTPANQPSHAATHNDLRDEIVAIETALGLNPANGLANVSTRITEVETLSNNNEAALSGKASTTHASTHGAGQSDAITIAPSQISSAGATNGQALAWSTSTTAWVPTTIGGGGGGSSLEGFRNRLHNGNFAVWQRGTSVSVTAATPTYTADRWFVKPVNATTVTATPSGTRKSRLNISDGAGAGSADIVQRISAEDSYYLSGQSVTVSGIFKATSGTVTVALYKPSSGTDNTWGTYGAARTLIGSPVTLTTNSSSRQSATFNAVVDTTAGLELVITFSNISSANAVYLEDVQLEAGSASTTFERRPYSVELDICQKFYERISNTTATNQVMIIGSQQTSNKGIVALAPYASPKRSLPSSVSMSAGSTWGMMGAALDPAGTVNTTVTLGTITASPNGYRITATSSGSLSFSTGGAMCGMYGTPGAYIEASADL